MWASAEIVMMSTKVLALQKKEGNVKGRGLIRGGPFLLTIFTLYRVQIRAIGFKNVGLAN